MNNPYHFEPCGACVRPAACREHGALCAQRGEHVTLSGDDVERVAAIVERVDMSECFCVPERVELCDYCAAGEARDALARAVTLAGCNTKMRASASSAKRVRYSISPRRSVTVQAAGNGAGRFGSLTSLECRAMRAFLLLLLLPSVAHASGPVFEHRNANTFHWSRQWDVPPSVSITIEQKSFAEMREALERYTGAQLGPHTIVPGLSLLYHDASGAWRCKIWVYDRGDAYAIKHERRHCRGWIHQEPESKL